MQPTPARAGRGFVRVRESVGVCVVVTNKKHPGWERTRVFHAQTDRARWLHQRNRGTARTSRHAMAHGLHKGREQARLSAEAWQWAWFRLSCTATWVVGVWRTPTTLFGLAFATGLCSAIRQLHATPHAVPKICKPGPGSRDRRPVCRQFTWRSSPQKKACSFIVTSEVTRDFIVMSRTLP
jgi:hypothetical protein